MDFLSIIFGPEWWKDEISIRQYLPKSGNVTDGGSIRPNPDYVGRGVAMCAAFDDGSGGVGKVDAVGRLAYEHRTGSVVLGVRTEDEQSQKYYTTKHGQQSRLTVARRQCANDLEKITQLSRYPRCCNPCYFII
jgi:hypothetical protein